MLEHSEIDTMSVDPIQISNLMRYLNAVGMRFDQEGLHLYQNSSAGYIHTHIGSSLDMQMIKVAVGDDITVDNKTVMRTGGYTYHDGNDHEVLSGSPNENQACDWPVAIIS